MFLYMYLFYDCIDAIYVTAKAKIGQFTNLPAISLSGHVFFFLKQTAYQKNATLQNNENAKNTFILRKQYGIKTK